MKNRPGPFGVGSQALMVHRLSALAHRVRDSFAVSELRDIGRASVAAVLLAGVAAAQNLPPDVPDLSFPGADGHVDALALAADVLYVGGDFTHIGPVTGAFATIEAADGALVPPSCRISGSVRAVIPDGAGGWILGGNFTSVCGEPRSNVARLSAAGDLLPWAPVVGGTVNALGLSGDSVFVGGDFTLVAGQKRLQLASIGLAEGNLLPWDPNPCWSVVLPCTGAGQIEVLLVDGARLLVGGDFEGLLGGQLRAHLAALDLASGQATAWDPAPDGPVLALARSGDDLFLGGQFSEVGGAARQNLARVDAATGLVETWAPDADSSVFGIAVSEGAIYVGGLFGHVSGVPRARAASLDPSSGALLPFDPEVGGSDGGSGGVHALALLGNDVLLAGDFESVQGAPRQNFACVDGSSGAPLQWGGPVAGPHATTVLDVHVLGDVVAIGGEFAIVGGAARRSLAALHWPSGELLPWNPGTIPIGGGSGPGHVSALRVAGGRLYVGGQFIAAGGHPTSHLAAFDLATGSVSNGFVSPLFATNWNVADVAFGAGRLFVAGSFQLPGDGPANLVALDPATGILDPGWAVSISGKADALATSPDGATLYVGGQFDGFGTPLVEQRNLAALSSSDASLLAWSPTVDDRVRALAVEDDEVQIGGQFDFVGEVIRKRWAAVDRSTGLPTEFDPQPGGPGGYEIYALAARGALRLGGGRFGSVAGSDLDQVAAVDGEVGTPTSWRPAPDDTVSALLVDGHQIVVAGSFDSLGGAAHPHLARFAVPSLVATPSTLSVSAGGVQTFRLDAGSAHAGRSYLLLGSATGTTPPTIADGVPVPLTLDTYTLATITFANSVFLPGSFGLLDQNGAAAASLLLPPGLLAAAGGTLHHAFVVFGPSTSVVYASESVELELGP